MAQLVKPICLTQMTHRAPADFLPTDEKSKNCGHTRLAMCY